MANPKIREASSSRDSAGRGVVTDSTMLLSSGAQDALMHLAKAASKGKGGDYVRPAHADELEKHGAIARVAEDDNGVFAKITNKGDVILNAQKEEK